MAQKRVRGVDADTGEMLDYVPMLVLQKRRNGFKEGWLAMAQTALEQLATSDLRGEDLRVLMLLMARLDFDNLIQVPQVEIADKLGMHKQHVNRSIQRLVELGCLLQGPRVGRSRTYRLNPNFGWKGSAKSHHEALRERMKASRIEGVVQGGGGERDPNTIDMFE